MQNYRPGKIIKVENKEYGLRQHNSRSMIFVYYKKKIGYSPIGFIHLNKYCTENELNFLLEFVTNFKEFVPSSSYKNKKKSILDDFDKLDKEFNYLMEVDDNED